ncbi:MAG: type I-C CRISPR-associated protein Cas8c/Csd1 [Planctomycetes bacterium]|nr:type I-C CRISPR-associated protein Cas8c/Csd1 [Planctomycetota bacterium]
MILQALADYYERLADDPSVEIAPPGFEQKAIDFLIVLDPEGNLVNLLDAREGTGRKRRGRPTLVPKAVKRTAGIAANLLWDTVPYVVGRALPEKGKNFEKQSARAVQKHEAFIQRIRNTFSECSDPGIQAVLLFLNRGDFSAVFAESVWQEIEENGGNLSFVLVGDSQLVCQRLAVVEAFLASNKPSGNLQVCAISGRHDVPAKLHAPIKGVWGAQSSGANIVSFNLDAFRSFGKTQGYNAPVGQQVEFAYTTALNYLLASERLRIQVGDASTVFWAKEPCDLEKDFYTLIGQPREGEEAVAYESIRSLLSAVKTGIPPEEADLPFYVLGLAPNASRISVRFWYDGNVKEIKERIAGHFRDIEIVRAPYDPEFLSLFRLLLSTARQHKADNIPPNVGGELARAILMGRPYPGTLFANAIRRCKAEQEVGFARAAIIKGFLARKARLSQSTNKEVSVALDKTYDNMGYVLGRLFAVLERIQEQAQGGHLNKTIRDTYFGAASSSPLVTFRRLHDLAIHHLAKMRNSGKNTVWMEKQLGGIEDLIPAMGIPAILNLEDQGRFAVGYYHQRQYFFSKKETENEGGEA